MICSESFFKKPKLFEELQKASQLFFSFLSKFKKTLLIFHVFIRYVFKRKRLENFYLVKRQIEASSKTLFNS